MSNQIFKQGDKVTENFVGTAYVNMLVSDPNGTYDTTVYDVLFKAGARNNWHSHPQGQLLLCTSGIGYYQEKGQSARRLIKGDVVEIPPNAVHWHGAAPDNDFSHIGITPRQSHGAAVWYEAVTDEEYKEQLMFNMYTPTRTLFGAGQLGKLHEQAMPGKKAMLVISNGKAVKENGALARTQEELTLAGVAYAVFDKVESNPLKETIEAGAAFARDNDCDFVVALGGGSVMDAAKVMAMLATNGGDLWDYVHGGSGKALPAKNPALPMIAITTTAGTGSEVDAYGVVTKPDTHEKIGIGGLDSMLPVIAIVDPELMTTVPPEFTAYQGFDAFFHSAEGFISKFANPLSEMYTLAAIENIATYLPRAVKNGNDLEARERVAFGNTMSGLEMVVGATSSQHSLEHALSAYHQDLPHGAGLIMISKGYFPFFIDKHVCDERFVKMARVMGMTNANKPEDFTTALEKLKSDCGVSDLKMLDYGVIPEELSTIAKNARDTMGGLFYCDRYSLTDKDSTAILKAAYK